MALDYSLTRAGHAQTSPLGTLTRRTRASAIVAVALLLPLSATGTARTFSDPRSLCASAEVNLFTCRIRTKSISVCGQGPGRAVYRFGLPGRIELEAAGLHHAREMFWGGGETQVYFDKGGYRTIVFDRTIRTNFGASGRHDSQFITGLIFKRGARTLSSRLCEGAGATIISGELHRYMPEAPYIEH